MKILGLFFITIITASAYYAEASNIYRQTLVINTFIFKNESFNAGDDIDAPPTTYWLEAGIRDGFGVSFYCDTDRSLCDKVDSELYHTLKKQSNQLDVETKETFLTPYMKSETRKICSYRYQHTTTLNSGRQIELIETSPSFTCAGPEETLKCSTAKYKIVEHPSGWKYCVWVGIR